MKPQEVVRQNLPKSSSLVTDHIRKGDFCCLKIRKTTSPKTDEEEDLL